MALVRNVTQKRKKYKQGRVTTGIHGANDSSYAIYLNIVLMKQPKYYLNIFPCEFPALQVTAFGSQERELKRYEDSIERVLILSILSSLSHAAVSFPVVLLQIYNIYLCRPILSE